MGVRRGLDIRHASMTQSTLTDMLSPPPATAKARRREDVAKRRAAPHIVSMKERSMARLGLFLLIVLALAACSAYGPNRQVPIIDGVPVDGGGMGGGVNR